MWHLKQILDMQEFHNVPNFLQAECKTIKKSDKFSTYRAFDWAENAWTSSKLKVHFSHPAALLCTRGISMSIEGDW